MEAVRFVTRLVVVALVICEFATAFISARNSPRSRLPESTPTFQYPPTLLRSSTNAGDADVSALLDVDPAVAAKFKVVTCMSTACSKKRTVLGMDEFSTFAAFWGRSRDRTSAIVEVEEVSCLGSCQQAPCVAIVHEDYEGSVALEGMDQTEFNANVFQRVITEDDADRVWSCVENAIITMAEEDEEEEEESEVESRSV
jgi:(2Fe-2S) ferredoxin